MSLCDVAIGFSGRDNGRGASTEVCPTIRAMNDHKYNRSSGWSAAVAIHGFARRLTPTECETLQGFPAKYTMVPHMGKPQSECGDAGRYKSLGNSMAVSVMRWLGDRMHGSK